MNCIICGRKISSIDRQDTCSGNCWTMAARKESRKNQSRYIEIGELHDKL